MESTFSLGCEHSHLHTVAVEVPMSCMTHVLFKLLQAVQHCLFKKCTSLPNAALLRQRTQLLYTGQQTCQIALNLLVKRMRMKRLKEDIRREINICICLLKTNLLYST